MTRPRRIATYGRYTSRRRGRRGASGFLRLALLPGLVLVAWVIYSNVEDPSGDRPRKAQAAESTPRPMPQRAQATELSPRPMAERTPVEKQRPVAQSTRSVPEAPASDLATAAEAAAIDAGITSHAPSPAKPAPAKRTNRKKARAASRETAGMMRPR